VCIYYIGQNKTKHQFNDNVVIQLILSISTVTGGMLTMTGDVLPCFDASFMTLPEDTSCIITVPITLDVASNHGVIVAAETEVQSSQNYTLSLVDNLLQKPNVDELVESKAVLVDGRTLLDTGIIAVRGKAWLDLVTLACSSQEMISDLIRSSNEVLYSWY
jgi:fucokinase